MEDGRNQPKSIEANGTTNTSSKKPATTTTKKRGRPPKILSLKGQPKIGSFLVQKQPADCTIRIERDTLNRIVETEYSTIVADKHETLVGQKTKEVENTMGGSTAQLKNNE